MTDNAPVTAEIRKIAENFQMRLTANHTAEPGKIWWASIQFPDVLGQVLAERERLALRNLAEAIKKVCPEVIPQIVAAAHPEDEFIAFLRGAELESAGTAECHADSDGDCNWRQCPQLRDGEPRKSGRDCPLNVESDEESAGTEITQLAEERASLLTALRIIVEDKPGAALNAVQEDYKDLVELIGRERAKRGELLARAQWVAEGVGTGTFGNKRAAAAIGKMDPSASQAFDAILVKIAESAFQQGVVWKASCVSAGYPPIPAKPSIDEVLKIAGSPATGAFDAMREELASLRLNLNSVIAHERVTFDAMQHREQKLRELLEIWERRAKNYAASAFASQEIAETLKAMSDEFRVALAESAKETTK